MTIKLFSQEYHLLHGILNGNGESAGQLSTRLVNKLLKLNLIAIESESFGRIDKVKLTDAGLIYLKDIEANSTECDPFVDIYIRSYVDNGKYYQFRDIQLPPLLLNNGELSDRGINIFSSFIRERPISYTEELVKLFIENENILNIIKIIPKENIPFLLSRLSQEEAEKLSKSLAS